MLTLIGHLLRRLTARTLPCTPSIHPDQMPLRDWADLPPYHPLVDRAPC